MTPDPNPGDSLRVVVAGGGIAGAETLLALRELAGDRVAITLVSPATELVLPPLSVAEAFALGHAQRYPLEDLLARVRAKHIPDGLVSVDASRREIALEDGGTVPFDALVITVGAKPVERVEHAITWWPRSDSEAFHGLLRDLEEGYSKRVAFVIPPGAVWPLPLYEIALMTARQVADMGITDAELTVITPEALPLALFGAEAATALRDELSAAGIGLEAAAVARIDRGQHDLQVVLAPSTRRLAVDRVVALPGVEGPRIPGTAQDDDGFIRVGPNGKMLDTDSVWAAGDAVAYPVKFGGIAAQQADAVASDVARRAGAEIAETQRPLVLRGVLMTGAVPRGLGAETESSSAPKRFWQPAEKVFGRYLTPYLQGLDREVDEAVEGPGVVVEETLPEPGDDGQVFHALWREGSRDPDHLRRLGHDIREYEQRHRQSASVLRQHGQLGERR